MSATSRRKGAQFERDVAKMLRPLYPEARRGLQMQGGVVPDVDGTPYWLECKVGKNPPLRPAMLQACRDKAAAKDARPPVVVAKTDRAEPLVLMYLCDWLELVGGVRDGLGE